MDKCDKLDKMDKFNVLRILKEYSFEIDETNKDYLCIICKNILSHAHSGPCGCRFCYDCPGDTNECKQRKLNLNKNIHYEPSVNTRISKLIVKCPKGCQFKDEIRKIENHIRVCNFRQINCPYFNIGCKQSNLINDNMKNHFLSDIVTHSNLLLELIENMRNEMELLKKDIGELKNENKSLKDEIEIIKLDRNVNQIKICELERKEKMNNDEIVELNEEMMVLKNENRYLKDEIEIMKSDKTNENMSKTIETIIMNADLQTVDIDEIKIKLKMIENNQNEFDEIYIRNVTLNKKLQINDFQIKMSEIQGEFEWKIDDFSKLERNKQVYSKSFFAYQNGYQMCLSINVGKFLNEKIYLHVYLNLMRGEFDDGLIWPCKCDVSIDLINQNNNQIYKNETIKYNNRPKNSQWDKPTNERNEVIHFISISLEKILLKNDQLLIKCITNIPQ